MRLSYGSPSSYSWEDDAGTQRKVTQAEGGEQGDPLMPLLFSIAIHAALEEVASHLEDGEQLCAFLDDVYVLCLPHRVVPLFKVFARVSGQSRRHQTPRRQNEGLEQERDCARGHRRIGRGGMAARRLERFLAHPSGLRSSPLHSCANEWEKNDASGTPSPP